MIAMIAAALAATAAPAPMPPEHAQHHQMASQAGDMAGMKNCCCKDMMEKMHSGHAMDRMHDHQDNKPQ